jgi:hypothetical protein
LRVLIGSFCGGTRKLVIAPKLAESFAELDTAGRVDCPPSQLGFDGKKLESEIKRNKTREGEGICFEMSPL